MAKRQCRNLIHDNAELGNCPEHQAIEYRHRVAAEGIFNPYFSVECRGIIDVGERTIRRIFD